MDKCEACGEGAVLTETKWMCDDCGHWNREYEEIEEAPTDA